MADANSVSPGLATLGAGSWTVTEPSAGGRFGSVGVLTPQQILATQALVSGAGNQSRAAWQSGAYIDALGWLRPYHRQILNPATYDIANISTAAGVAKSNAPAGAGEFCGQDIVFSMAGVTAAGNTDVPLLSDGYGAYPAVGFRTCVRVWCDDWSKVTDFGIYYIKDKTTYTDRYQHFIVASGISTFGMTDPVFAAAWNSKYRTICLRNDEATRNVATSLPAWAGGGGAPEEFAAQALRFRIATTGACTIKINRIYSPKWPIGVYGPIGDGCYQSFKASVVAPLAAAGYSGTVDLYSRGETYGGIYPWAADLREVAAANWDVLPHLNRVDAAAVAFAGTETAAQIEAQIETYHKWFNACGLPADSYRFAQFLQNSGKSNAGAGVYMAQEMAKRGILASRGYCVDGRWGIDPHNTAKTRYLAGQKPRHDLVTTAGALTTNAGLCCGWSPERGQYNLNVDEWFEYDTTYWPQTPANRDTYPGSIHAAVIDKASAYADVAFGYTHEITSNPTIYNSGTSFTRDLLADIMGKAAAGRLLIMSMSQFYALTYGRADDIRLRWDGEWVNPDGSIAL